MHQELLLWYLWSRLFESLIWCSGLAALSVARTGFDDLGGILTVSEGLGGCDKLVWPFIFDTMATTSECESGIIPIASITWICVIRVTFMLSVSEHGTLGVSSTLFPCALCDCILFSGRPVTLCSIFGYNRGFGSFFHKVVHGRITLTSIILKGGMSTETTERLYPLIWWTFQALTASWW